MQNQSLEEEITERETAGIVTTRAIDDPAHNTFHLHAPALNRRKPYTFEEENLNCGQEVKTHRDTKNVSDGDVDEDDDEEDDDEVHKVKKSEPRNTSFSI
ncbi:hypothetical protein DY000_02046365 [Brassica cretica]|uniref:Protein TSSC4 n=1 Tax=Brassica cretica TaxID=69181 RepID=A0ABQ7F315_BRACR|nr:hypothetical protein DY000_02046365 [Brassica cretica]